MTPKQEERIRSKIKKLKAALAADKKQWGGFYHDGRGLRYEIPRLYIQIGDYTGGLRYVNWFNKNFPDDAGFPYFLFEWAIILFKTGRIKQAEKKAFQAFCRNTYMFDKFFGNPIKPIDKLESSNLDTPEFAKKYFEYSANQEELADFATWLRELISTEKFSGLCKRFIDAYARLKTEHDPEVRHYLVRIDRQLESEL